MGIKDFTITAAALVISLAFGWATSLMCAHPQFAFYTLLIAGIVFAILGPVWAYFSKDDAMWHRILAGSATVTIGAIATPIALWQNTACGQTSPSPMPTVNCSLSVGGDNHAPMTNDCGNTYGPLPPKAVVKEIAVTEQGAFFVHRVEIDTKVQGDFVAIIVPNEIHIKGMSYILTGSLSRSVISPFLMKIANKKIILLDVISDIKNNVDLKITYEDPETD